METIEAVSVPQSLEDARSAIQAAYHSLDALIEKHNLDADDDLSTALDALKKRVGSNEVRLAVLGEFSAGKTTFVNSLLKTDVLNTGILPTTAVCTYISYGASTECEVVHRDGGIARVTPDEVKGGSIEETRNADVVEVRLKLAAPSLANGLIVIDTPGVNVNIDKHEEITNRALREANACVYVMDARQPGKKTTIDFLRRIQPKIDKFFFVLNRADILDHAEQEEALEFVTATLTNDCGISEPKVALLSSVQDAGAEWQERFRAVDQSLRDFMLSDRDSVICAELARLLDHGIERSEKLLESKYRLAEQELSAHYKTSLPDATEIVRSLGHQIDSTIASDSAKVERLFLTLHQSVCPSLRSEVESCISHTFTVDGLVNSAPQSISKTFEAHYDHLERSLAEAFQTIFSNRQAQVVATVSQLFSGVKWVDQKALLSRVGPWIAVLIGSISLFALERVYGAPRATLIISPFLGTAVAALFYGIYYWSRSRSLFSPSTLASLTHAGYVHSAIARGSLYKSAAANPIKANTAPINAGRAVGALTGNPWFTAAGAAVSGGLYGIRLLMDKASGKLDNLRNEIRESVSPALDDFEKSTKEDGLSAIRGGKEGIISALHSVLDKSMERYQIILDRLVKPHRRIQDRLEQRRNAIRADAEQLRASRQAVLNSLSLLEKHLKGTSSRYVKARTDARESDLDILRTKSDATSTIELLEINAVNNRNPLLHVWLGCLAVSILLTILSLHVAKTSSVVGVPDVGSTSSETVTTPTAAQPRNTSAAIDDYPAIRDALASNGYLADGAIMDVPGLTPGATLHVQIVTCSGAAEPCRKLFVFVGSESVWSEDLAGFTTFGVFPFGEPGKFSAHFTQEGGSASGSTAIYTWDGTRLSRSVLVQPSGDAAGEQSSSMVQPTNPIATSPGTDRPIQSVPNLAQLAERGTNNQVQMAPNPQARPDGQIEMDVVHALDASTALNNDSITAATVQGEVTLSGRVSNGASRELAERIVLHVRGVTKVRNDIVVSTSGRPNVESGERNPKIDLNAIQGVDNQITADVERAISVSLYYPRDKQIFVSTTRREVTLSGRVPSEKVKEMAESLAANVQGVTKVHNNLGVQQQNSARSDFRSQSPQMFQNAQYGEGGSGLWRSSQSGSVYKIDVTDSYITITPVSGTGHINAHVPIKLDKNGKPKIMGQWQSDGSTGFISITEISDQQITATMIVPQSPGAVCTTRTASFFENMNAVKQCKSVAVFWRRQ